MGPTIREGAAGCTVIVTVDAPPQLIPVLDEHARMGLGRFPDFHGFVAGALHDSGDGRLVQYLQWDSEEAYRACVNDPCWDELASTAVFMEAAQSGEVTVDARVFTVRAVSRGAADAGEG